jgi:hypothetical protein
MKIRHKRRKILENFLSMTSLDRWDLVGRESACEKKNEEGRTIMKSACHED